MSQLKKVFDVIGVTGYEPAHHIAEIVSALELFASLNGKPKLEKECEDYRNQLTRNKILK